MTVKRLINPHRRRKVPSQFSWVDHRLVRDRHIRKCTPDALALYLFLLTVGDADGLSYYSDAKAAGLLSMQPGQLAAARRNLVEAGLIAWAPPLYQVLDLQPEIVLPALDGSASATPGPPKAPQGSRSIGEILDALTQAGREQQGGAA